MHQLFINKNLLLEASAGGLVSFPKNKEMMKDLELTEEEVTELKKNIGIMTDYFNREVKDLKRTKKEPKGFHLPHESKLPENLKKKLTGGTDIPDSLPNQIFEEIIVKNLTKDDIIKPSIDGKKLDWLNFMIPDGKVFPYTILAENFLCRYGFPIGLYTKQGQDIVPGSIKNIYYIHPITKKISKGYYFEVSEAPGPKGDGGINGVISPEDQTLVIINHKRKEAYFVNAEKSLQRITTPITPKHTA